MMSLEVKGEVNVEDAAKSDNTTEVGEVIAGKTEEVKAMEENNVSINETQNEEEDGEENEEGEGRSQDTESLIVKMTGITRSSNLELEVGNFYKFFTKEMGVTAPLIHIPGPNDHGVLFKMMSLEDRNCVWKKCRKAYMWNTWKIQIKIMPSPKNEDLATKPLLPLEEALNTLYPYRNVYYHEQLTKKNWLVGNTLISLNMKEMKGVKGEGNREDKLTALSVLPATPIEGYDYSPYISLEENPETQKILAGIRVCKDGKTCIVPLDMCVSIPRDTVTVVQYIVKKLPEFGLKAINRVTGKGDIVGLGFRMTLAAKYTLFVAVPRIELSSFKSMTDEKGDLLKEEELQKGVEDSYLVVSQKRINEIKNKLKSYFEHEGKLHGIESVYVRFVGPCSVSLKESSGQKAYHILGSPDFLDIIQGHSFRVTGIKDHYEEGLRPLIGLVEANTALGRHSQIYLISDSVLIGLYLAKKCGRVTFQYCYKYQKKDLDDMAKASGIDNIQFVGKFHMPQDTTKLDDKTIVILWKSHNHSSVEKFIKIGVTNFIFINYWPAAFPEQMEECRKMYEAVSTKCKVHGIFPMDIAPYREHFAVAVFFSGLSHSPKQVLGPPPVICWPRRPVEGPTAPVKTEAPNSPPPKQKKIKFQGFYQGKGAAPPRVFPGPSQSWAPTPSPTSSVERVATGLMQNLQTVTQQIQSILPADRKQMSVASPWPPKRRMKDGGERPFGKRQRPENPNVYRWTARGNSRQKRGRGAYSWTSNNY